MASTVTPITWRNVNAPDGTGALNAFARAGDSLGRSIGGFGDAIQEGANQYADSQTESFIAELNAAPDDAARKQMVQQASEAFLKMDKVNAAVTDAQNQDFLVNAEARNQGRFGFEQAAEAYREKTRPLSLRGLEATTETSERTNDIGELYDKSNAKLDNELKILTNKYKEETDPLRKQQLEQGISVTAEALRHAKTMNPENEDTATRTGNAARTMLKNDQVAEGYLATLANPNAPDRDRNEALGKLQELQNSSSVSTEVMARIQRAGTQALERQAGYTGVGFTPARNALGSVLDPAALQAYDSGDVNTAIINAPKNLGSLLQSNLVETIRREPGNAGLTEPQLVQLAKQRIAKDSAIQALISKTEERDTLQTDVNAIDKAAKLSGLEGDREIAVQLQNGSYNKVAETLAKKYAALGGATIDPEVLGDVVKTTHQRARARYKNSGLKTSVIDSTVVKMLQNTIADFDVFSKNDVFLPGYTASSDPTLGDDVSTLPNNVFDQAFSDLLLPGERLQFRLP